MLFVNFIVFLFTILQNSSAFVHRSSNHRMTISSGQQYLISLLKRRTVTTKYNSNFDQEQMQSFLEDIEEYNIDSFLRGDYDRPFSEDAAAPHPGIVRPSDMLESALTALRALHEPELNHGAAVFLRFCIPLTRNERWGGGVTSISGSTSLSPWKELLRGALTPNMFAGRIDSSPQFSILLHWHKMTIANVSMNEKNAVPKKIREGTALINVQFHSMDEVPADSQKEFIIQFHIQKYNGVWMIADAFPIESPFLPSS